MSNPIFMYMVRKPSRTPSAAISATASGVRSCGLTYQ